MSTGRNIAIGVGVILLLVAFGASAKEEPDEPGPDGPEPPEPDPDDPFIVTPIPRPDEPDPFIVDPGVIQIPPLPDIVNPFPTGGTFYQVVKGDKFLGTSAKTSIVYRWLRTEGFLAAKEIGGLDNDAANDFGKEVAGRADNRIDGLNLIQCAYVNDAAYGTWGYGKKARPSPHGRAIRLIKHHPSNLQRLRDGKPLARNIELGSPNDKGKGNAEASDSDLRDQYELLWLPKLNLSVLWNSNGGTLTTEGESWVDGSSKMNPPPWVMGRGIEDFSDSGFDDWGC